MNEILHQAASTLNSHPELLLTEEVHDLPIAQRFLERQRLGQLQEKLIEAWAEDEGLWWNTYTDKSGKEYDTLENLLETEYIPSQFSGSEAIVYMDKSGDWLTKAISLLHENDNIQMMLERIALYNKYFPATALEIIGFGRDCLDKFRVIVKQRFLTGTYPSVKEIFEYAENLDFSLQHSWWYSPDESFRMTDLTPLNLIKIGDGQLYPIDIDMELTHRTFSEETLSAWYRVNQKYVLAHIKSQPHLTPFEMEDQMQAIHERVYHGGNLYKWERL